MSELVFIRVYRFFISVSLFYLLSVNFYFSLSLFSFSSSILSVYIDWLSSYSFFLLSFRGFFFFFCISYIACTVNSTLFLRSVCSILFCSDYTSSPYLPQFLIWEAWNYSSNLPFDTYFYRSNSDGIIGTRFFLFNKPLD